MMITKDLWIATKRNGGVQHNLTGKPEFTNEEPYESKIRECLRVFRSKRFSEEERLNILQETRELLAQRDGTQISEEDPYEAQLRIEQQKRAATQNIQLLMNFFSEFSFSPNFRFVNTFAKTCKNFGKRYAKEYIANYFALTDNGYYNQICDKMNSSEFEDIISAFYNIGTTKSINNRFKLYYGSQGTGKTTIAMEEANNNCTVCHSAMLPSDLMEDFAFDDGKATFKPSQLYKAMTEGKTIVLDEINLLPFESLRFLQSILDGKSSFVYKGQTVQIKDGFQIIGTMNLQVNGMVYALPEPLVDRASELKEFKLSAADLVGAIL